MKLGDHVRLKREISRKAYPGHWETYARKGDTGRIILISSRDPYVIVELDHGRGNRTLRKTSLEVTGAKARA